jgi:glycosyltransferase involved in cell wall biosynthesis
VSSFVLAVPGDLATPTGGYAYDRRMITELAGLGWRVEVADIGNDFPRPSARTLDATRSRLSAVAKGIPIVIDGLAFGAIPELAADLHPDHPLIALVHHPLALESGLSAADAERFLQRERAALAYSDNVIVTSPATARLLSADYGVDSADITVAVPGSEPRVPAPGSHDGTLALLAVGSVVRRKGYDVLVAALAGLRDLSWRLTIAGDLGRDPATAYELDSDIRRRGLGDRIALVGAVQERRLDELYGGADIFVLPSRHEGYGMAFSEAIARGLPVVGTTAGAIPETVPTEAGVLVPPDDSDALAQALRHLIEQPGERRRLAAGARAAAGLLPTWRQSAELFARAIEAVS